METHNFERLKAHIMPMSHASEFELASREWKLIGIEISEEFDQCPCGQDIKEHCYIQNQKTGRTTYVGNVCINRFLRIDTGNTFAGLRRIAKDDTANANLDLVLHAQQLGYLFDGEYEFLVSTARKRKLSAKQLVWKQKINRRITNKTVVKRRGEAPQE
jgi:hypothetical protein